MTQSPIGSHKQDLETPILCIDLDVLEANIARMAGYMRDRGKNWRPHQKCHKTPAIAWKQLAAGAIGVTCAKVSEAEVMAASGIRDILLANMVVGQRKWERVASLCRSADPIVACDDEAQVVPLAETCRRHGVTCRMLIEVDLGMKRVGVPSGESAVRLAETIDRLAGVELAGVMGYEGHLLDVADQEEKRQRIGDAMAFLVSCRDQIEARGMACDIVSAGGTGSYQMTSDCAGVTELQAGGGIFADPWYRNMCQLEGLAYSLSVLATVVSRPAPDRAVLDAGLKACNILEHPPVCMDAGIDIGTLHAEHCELHLSGEGLKLRIGDKVEMVPGYSDLTTPLHDQFYGFRGDRLELVWPILGRGKLQ